MDWNTQRPAIEIAVEWIAAASVGSAVAFACWMLAPIGAVLAAAPLTGAVGAAGALFVMGRVDRRGQPSEERFVPVDFGGDGELMLDAASDGDDALLLDDPLPALGEDSRVVRLFAMSPAVSEPPPLPGPGEMAARIEHFLGGPRAASAAVDSALQAAPAATDASAALHAALADIRRSLRQA